MLSLSYFGKGDDDAKEAIFCNRRISGRRTIVFGVTYGSSVL